MSTRLMAAAALIALVAAAVIATAGPSARSSSNYALGCGGCHGIEGVSNPHLVPQLRDQVGYFLSTPQGRQYVVRLPNVAFYAASDAELADILNYAVFALGGKGVPANAKPYTAFEVKALRKSPLNEVSLIDYRNALVEDLIAHHGAPTSLRIYSSATYQ